MDNKLKSSDFSYLTTQASSPGNWIHAPGSNFTFAYLYDSWSDSLKSKVGEAFLSALSMSDKIKEAVKNTSGQEAVEGLYILDQEGMTKAMNSIPGMGMTDATNDNLSGNGTASDVNKLFFQNILAGLGGDVTPMMDYLNQKMNDIQTQAKKSDINTDFGTVIGLVSVMPILNIPVISFVYAYMDKNEKTWFEHYNCKDHKKESFDIKYAVVSYNYNYR